MKRIIAIGSGVFLLAFVLGQLHRAELSNPVIDPGRDLIHLHPTDSSTAALLRAACYDCHSNQTQWPWYTQVNPVSFWIVGHVNHGRDEINFSDWQIIQTEDVALVGRKCADLIQDNSMPMPSYLRLHPEARLDARQRQQLINYFRNLP